MSRRQTGGRWPTGRLAMYGTAAMVLIAVIAVRSQEPSPADFHRAQSALHSTFRLATDPPLPAERLINWRDPVVAAWLADDPWVHRLRGTVLPVGRELVVKPWLYTTSWLAQPVVEVDDDGRFEARLTFDQSFDAPMIIRLEIEDRATLTVIATYSFYLVQPGGRHAVR